MVFTRAVGWLILGLTLEACVGVLGVDPGADAGTNGPGEDAGATVVPDGGLVPTPRFSPCGPLRPSTGLPVTDPNARWERVKDPDAGSSFWAGTTVQGYLDGPRLEARSFSSTMPAFFEDGNDYVFRAWDPETDRFVTVAGGARGYLDGPFSRARFSGWGYAGGLATACAPDGTLFVAEPALRTVRVMDFETQTVSTVLRDIDALAIAASADGRTLYVAEWGKVSVVDRATWTVVRTVPYTSDALPAHGFSIALDDKHQRLYAANRCAGAWYVWYWDLVDGSFHGVLPLLPATAPQRPLNVPGPFDGTALHCPVGIAFGPDDPDYRFLYYGGGDSTTFWRLDLVGRMVDAFGPDDASRQPYVLFRFTHDYTTRLPFLSVSSWAGLPTWGQENNDVLLGQPISSAAIRFRRLQ